MSPLGMRACLQKERMLSLELTFYWVDAGTGGSILEGKTLFLPWGASPSLFPHSIAALFSLHFVVPLTRSPLVASSLEECCIPALPALSTSFQINLTSVSHPQDPPCSALWL